MTNVSISADEFDRRFDEGEELEEYLDMDNPVVTKADGTRRVNFNMPGWLIDALDKEAKHLAISRQAVAIIWLADRAKQEHLTV